MVRRRRRQLKATQLRLNSLGKMVRRGLEGRIGEALEKEEQRRKGIYIEGERYLRYPDLTIEGFEPEDEMMDLYLKGKLKKLWR